MTEDDLDEYIERDNPERYYSTKDNMRYLASVGGVDIGDDYVEFSTTSGYGVSIPFGTVPADSGYSFDEQIYIALNEIRSELRNQLSIECNVA